MDVIDIIRTAWQKYDRDGQGYLDLIEAKHFIGKYCRERLGIPSVPEKVFGDWYQSLNRNG